LSEPLIHRAQEETDDVTLRREAELHLEQHVGLQVVAELLVHLRKRQLPWWSAEDLRAAFGARERLLWLRDRPDLRAHVVATLTQLPLRAARKKSPQLQAELVEAFLEDGDVSARQFEEAFDPFDLVVYGPATEFFRRVRERMPLEDPETAGIVGALLASALADRSARGLRRTPLLSAWEVRAAIPTAVWQTRIPLALRAAVDEARLARERAGEVFTSKQELALVTPDAIVQHVPMAELVGVLDLVQRALGAEARPRREASAVRVIEPAIDPDALLAAIARRASSAPPPPPRTSTPPPPRTRNVPRHDPEKTQPRIQLFPRH